MEHITLVEDSDGCWVTPDELVIIGAYDTDEGGVYVGVLGEPWKDRASELAEVNRMLAGLGAPIRYLAPEERSLSASLEVPPRDQAHVRHYIEDRDFQSALRQEDVFILLEGGKLRVSGSHPAKVSMAAHCLSESLSLPYQGEAGAHEVGVSKRVRNAFTTRDRGLREGWIPDREAWPSTNRWWQGAACLLATHDVIQLLPTRDVKGCRLAVNCNDVFHVATADAEPVPSADIEPVAFWSLYHLVRRYGSLGALSWAVWRRGTPPQEWIREALEKENLYPI